MANPTVIATSQAIEHFKNVVRLAYTCVGGGVSETVVIGDITLSKGDYIRVISDPNTQVVGARIIEIKASRSVTNGTIMIGSCDGTTNIPGGLVVEIVIIKRQQNDGQVAGDSNGFGNASNTIFGHLDESGSSSNDFSGSGPLVIPIQALLTLDSCVFVDQKSVSAGMPSGIIEAYASRVSGTSFTVGQANNGETPVQSVDFDWAVLNP